MHIVAKTNEINTKNKSFKKGRCCCNGKVNITYLSIFKCFETAIQIYSGKLLRDLFIINIQLNSLQFAEVTGYESCHSN